MMRSGEVAAAADVHPETLRYYERRGLLKEPARSAGGSRLYPAETVDRVRFIKSAQKLGFTLAEIADLLDSCWDGNVPSQLDDLRSRAAEKVTEIERRIVELAAIRDTLQFGVAGRCTDPIGYLASTDFRLANLPEDGTSRAGDEWDTDMTTISTDHPLAVAAVTAIHAGDVESLRRLLTDHPGLAAVRVGDDDPDGMSRTLLHVVADWPGHFPQGAESVATLVETGADVNARFHGSHRETPLHWAASSNDVAVLDALIDAGADMEADGAIIGGGTPLADARGFAQWEVAFRLVERGARTTMVDEATLGLMDRLVARFDSPTPPAAVQVDHALWGACHGGRREAVEFLLARGANPHWIPPWENLTALDAARRSGALELAGWLRDQGGVSADDGGRRQ